VSENGKSIPPDEERGIVSDTINQLVGSATIATAIKASIEAKKPKK
jgi:hypothetical protein